MGRQVLLLPHATGVAGKQRQGVGVGLQCTPPLKAPQPAWSMGVGGGEEGLDHHTFSLSAHFGLCCGGHGAGTAQGAKEEASPWLPTVVLPGLRRPPTADASPADSPEIRRPC